MRAASAPASRRWPASLYQARSSRSSPSESMVPPVKISATRGRAVLPVTRSHGRRGGLPDRACHPPSALAHRLAVAHHELAFHHRPHRRALAFPLVERRDLVLAVEL